MKTTKNNISRTITTYYCINDQRRGNSSVMQRFTGRARCEADAFMNVRVELLHIEVTASVLLYFMAKKGRMNVRI